MKGIKKSNLPSKFCVACGTFCVAKKMGTRLGFGKILQ